MGKFEDIEIQNPHSHVSGGRRTVREKFTPYLLGQHNEVNHLEFDQRRTIIREE